jgi:eukaryotic-like serine/threonine-protein kinase
MLDSLPTTSRACTRCGTEYPPAVGRCPKDGAPTRTGSSLAGDHPLAGRFVGSYRLVRRIGIGSTGEVFLGEHPTLGKRVAIKILRPGVSEDQELVSRFFAEAQTIAHLEHPNIVELYDLSVLPDGRAYSVMEYLEGQSLARILVQRGRIPAGAALPLLLELLGALSAAHERGVIHRDVKPGNIFLAQRGPQQRVKLLDFGMAKLHGGPRSIYRPRSLPGTILGTPAYMAPEQCRGARVSAASDIYSVGVVLFEMLTGELPFGDLDEPRQLEAHQHRPPQRLSYLLPYLPPSLDALCTRALEKDPEARFRSAAEMAQEIERLLEGELAPCTQPTISLDAITAQGLLEEGDTTVRTLPRDTMECIDPLWSV